MNEKTINTQPIEKFLDNSKRLGVFFPRHCKKAIILAPHPDDETIGCGGIISKYNNTAIDMISVLFTYKEEEPRGVEYINAMKELGCRYQFIGLKDGELANHKEKLVTILQQLMDSICPDIVFTPYLLDVNPDHKAVSESLSEVIFHKDTLISMYEVWTPILYPNYYIDISTQIVKKEKALQCYESQENLYHLINKVQNLNRFRAELLMRRNSTHMEAFKTFDSCQFKEVVQSLTMLKLM